MDYFLRKFQEVAKAHRDELLSFRDILEIKIERASGDIEYYRKVGNQDIEVGGEEDDSKKE